MGQYRQWLLAQEVDQSLRAQLEALETELVQLQDQASLLKEVCLQENNPIICALAIGPSSDAVAISSPGLDTAVDEFIQRIAPSLLDWSENGSTLLPDTHKGHGRDKYLSGKQEPLPNGDTAALPASEVVPLPEDVLAGFGESGQIEPQSELSWWLDTPAVSSNTGELAIPIDQESLRTNRLVQRWVERWRQRHVMQQRH